MGCDMSGSGAAKAPHGKERTGQANAGDEHLLDRELVDLPVEMRWREWILRVEAVIFASAEPVSRETLARVVGKECSIDLIDDLREELRSRRYEIVFVAGCLQHRSRSAYASAIRASQASTRGAAPALSYFEAMVLMAIAYFQPIARGDLSKVSAKRSAATRSPPCATPTPLPPARAARRRARPTRTSRRNSSSPRSACRRSAAAEHRHSLQDLTADRDCGRHGGRPDDRHCAGAGPDRTPRSYCRPQCRLRPPLL